MIPQLLDGSPSLYKALGGVGVGASVRSISVISSTSFSDGVIQRMVQRERPLGVDSPAKVATVLLR
jgi:hypothetical protein